MIEAARPHTARSTASVSSAAPRPGAILKPGPAMVACFVLLAAVNVIGLPYYTASLGERIRHPLHPWLKPSGLVGQSLGMLAVVLFLFLWLYPLRKKLGARAAFTGRVPAWLDWHIAAGLLAPWAAATHAGWRFTGLIGLGYAAMFIVYLSGIVGRYIYTRIPRRRDGLELNRDEMAAEREKLLFELTARTGLPPDEVRGVLARDVEGCEGLSPLSTIRRMVSDDFARRRSARALARRMPRSAGGRSLTQVLRLARREMALSQQARMLDATQRLFKYWHIAHRPFAVTALIAVLAHIIVAILMGATWFL